MVYSGSSHVIDNFAPGYLHRESGQWDGKGFNLKLLYFLQRHPSQGDAVFASRFQTAYGGNHNIVALPLWRSLFSLRGCENCAPTWLYDRRLNIIDAGSC